MAEGQTLLILSKTGSVNRGVRLVQRSVLFLGCMLLAIFTALGTVLVIQIADRLIHGETRPPPPMWWESHQLECFIIYAGWCFFFWYRTLRSAREDDAIGWFHAEEIVLRRPVHESESGPRMVRLQPRDVGRIVRGPGAVISLGFGLTVDQEDGYVAIPVSALSSEDDFEHLENYLDQVSDHVFAIVEDGMTSYSRSWTLAELFPQMPDVSRAEVPLSSRREPIVEVKIEDRVWYYDARDGLVEPDDESRPVMQMRLNYIIHHTGMILGKLDSNTPGVLSVELGSGESLRISFLSSVIEIDGERIGAVAITEESVALDFDRPVPHLLAVLATLATMRSAVAMRL